jgi:predicted transcriptional regulator
MNSSELAHATAKTERERSDAIVVSFNPDWYEKIKKGTFSTIIRRLVPSTIEPRWLYFHINRPIKAICGRAPIRSTRRISRETALEFGSELDLSVSEIEEYIGDRKTIGIYEIGRIELSKESLSISKLARYLTYHPPQTYLALSLAGKKIIDELGGFADPKGHVRNGEQQ